jgi:hypothetical protein
MSYTLAQAGKAIGKNKTTVLRAIQSGKLSATRDEATGGWLIEPAELHRLYPAVADAAVRAVPDAALRNGHAPAATPEPADAWRLRFEAAEVRIADRDAQIADLRRRLDESEAERRTVQAQLTALLTDQRPPPAPEPPRGLWGRFLAWRR